MAKRRKRVAAVGQLVQQPRVDQFGEPLAQTAFNNLLVKSVIREDDRAVILWQATVSDAQVEAAELVSISDGAIYRVDVFLRPATVLDAVYQAMVAAWP